MPQSNGQENAGGPAGSRNAEPSTHNADRLPWFQFYVRDWLSEVRGLPLEAQGALISLWALQWDRGGLPNDQKKLASLLGVNIKQFTRIWKEIGGRFEIVPVGLLDARLARQQKEAIEQSRRRSHVAKRGAESRWSNNGKAVGSIARRSHGNANGNANGNPNGSADGSADGNTDGTVDSDPDAESQTDSAESLLEHDRWDLPDAKLKRGHHQVEKARKPLPDNWRPSLGTLHAVARTDCLPEDLLASFVSWAKSRGYQSWNWDAAFRKFAKRHRPSDAQLNRAKAADRLNVEVSMARIRAGVARMTEAGDNQVAR